MELLFSYLSCSTVLKNHQVRLICLLVTNHERRDIQVRKKVYRVKKGNIIPKLDPYPEWEREEDRKERKKYFEEHPEDDNLPWDTEEGT